MKKTVLVTLVSLLTVSPHAFSDPLDPYMCNDGRYSCSFACPQNCPKAIGQPAGFDSVGGHTVQGTAEIFENGHESLLQIRDFMTTPGPDLQVVLRDSRGIKPMRFLGPLRSFAFMSDNYNNYKIAVNPDLQDLDSYDEAVIYCAKYHVDFGVAKIR